MPNQEPAQDNEAFKERPHQVVNPQVAMAPGEEALEQMEEKAGAIASVQREEIQ